MQKSLLLWSSAYQLNYIPASPTLGCKYLPPKGAMLRVSRESGKYIEKPDRQHRGALAEEERRRFLESSGSCPLWFHYCTTASPRWRSVKAVLLSLALVQLQLAHAWNWSRATGTGSTQRESPALFLDKIQSTRLALTVTLQIWTWSKCSRGNWLREREAKDRIHWHAWMLSNMQDFFLTC